MNKYILSYYWILASFFSVFISCEDTRLDGMVDDKLYVINSGLYTVEVQDFGKVEYNHAVYKSGNGSDAASVSFVIDESLITSYNAQNGTGLQLLPSNCYSMEKTDAALNKDQERATVKIVFDSKAIYELQKGEQKYVLPLKMNSDSPIVADSAKLVSLISPKIVQPLTSFKIVGDFDPVTYFEDGSINGLNKHITLFKLTDAQAPAALTVKATFAENVTISPEPSVPQNFNNPVTYTLTNEKGETVTYTVQFKKPAKLAKGIRPGSGRVLWKKSMADLKYSLEGATGLHMAVAIATSGDKFIINQRYYKNYIYDWSKADKTGEMNLDLIQSSFNDAEGKNGLLNYAMTNDVKGNLLVCNLATGAGDFKIFKYSAPGDAGKEIVSFYNNTGGQVGRKLSVCGDLDKNAKIYATVTAVSKILVWTVEGGIVNQTPQVIQSPFAFSGIFTDAIANGLSDKDRIFVLNKKDFVQLSPVTGAIIKGYWLNWGGNEGSLDIATFNGSQYVAKYWMAENNSEMKGYLYTIDNPDDVVLAYEPAEATKFDGMPGNGNGSGDIALQVLSDGYRMIMYTFLTNGGAVATLFDCVDMDTE